MPEQAATRAHRAFDALHVGVLEEAQRVCDALSLVPYTHELVPRRLHLAGCAKARVLRSLFNGVVHVGQDDGFDVDDLKVVVGHPLISSVNRGFHFFHGRR